MSDYGVTIQDMKSTADFESVVMPVPDEVIIPMKQHIGVDCKPTVEESEMVSVGQIIGESKSYLSAPIHSSISGEVKNIIKITLPDGEKTDAILIKSDKKSIIHKSVFKPQVKDKKIFINAIRNSGLVGLGGAGFPTHAKLNTKDETMIDTLIINAAECEPYITSDYREIIENTNYIFSGIDFVKKFLNIKKVIVAIEEKNKASIIKALKKNVFILPSVYPQGAEKVLIKSCTGREVPIGKLPSDVGCLVMNVTSVSFVGKYMETGMPLISKRITVDGSAIREPKNVIVPIGTKISDVIDFCGGYIYKPKKILMGGPMMGLAVSSEDTPIIKQNNAITVLDEKDSQFLEERSCIRCGRCINVCPMKLMPVLLDRASRHNDKENLLKLNVKNCISCGCCSFVCPSKRDLVQSIKLGKKILK